jgi:hypothetical protein
VRNGEWGVASALIMVSAPPSLLSQGEASTSLRTWALRGDAPYAEWPHVADAVIEARFSSPLPRSSPPQGVRHEARQRQQQQARERQQQPPGWGLRVRVRRGTGEGAIIVRRIHGGLLLGVGAV